MAEPKPGPGGAPRVASLLLALASGLAATLAVEGGLRAARSLRPRAVAPGMPWLVADPIVGHRNRPGFRDPRLGIAIDALGFRGTEVAVAKSPGTSRVVCLGDSTTFGSWRQGAYDVRYDTSYPAELARRFDADPGPRVEVVNAGVMGYTVAHVLRLFVTRVARLAPDVVVVRIGNNDHALLGPQPWWVSGTTPVGLLTVLPPPLLDWEVVRLGDDAYQRVTAPPLPPAPVRRVPIDEFERDLGRLVAAIRGVGARPVFLDFPYRPVGRGPWRGEPLPNDSTDARTLEELAALHATYQAVVARVAAATGVALVRTEDALAAQADRTFTDFDNSHPTGDGYRVIAGVLHDALAPPGRAAAGGRSAQARRSRT
jgi:lysophospholipase L1-like esterase